MMVTCSVVPCTYDALGLASVLCPTDVPIMAVTMLARPVEQDGTPDPDDAEYLCRWHILERVENWLRDASRAVP
jgi:hypothetical protein